MCLALLKYQMICPFGSSDSSDDRETLNVAFVLLRANPNLEIEK